MTTATAQDDIEEGGSLARRIAAALSARIVDGTLLPGSPVRQDHVALEFRASHVPVREAFRMLEGQGLLVSEPRRGVRVAPLDPAAIHEVTQMRAALEALALREAMPNMTEATWAAAERALDDGEASSEIAVWERANRRFHHALAAPCGMPRLLAQLDELHQVSARFLFAAWQGLDWRPRSDEEHREILRLIRLHEADKAADLLARHIAAAGDALIANLSPPAGK
jgi:DNA-binding GntR family transcriptional regulator